MTKIGWAYLSAVLLFLIPLTVLAEQAPKYDAATEVTLEGQAIYVAEHPSRSSWTGVFAIMKDGSVGEIEVHLAPGDFLDREGVEIKRGDTIKVVGSKVRWSGTDIILAREVTANGKTVQLREKGGAKRW